MDLGIAGKVVIVTGASRGIGAAIAKALARYGALVVINYFKSREKAEEVLADIQKSNGKGMIIQADVRDRAGVEGMADTVLREFGKIDILFCNANISFPIKPFTELAWEEFEAKLTGEIGAMYNCSQAVLKDMLKRRSGKLVFVSSELSRTPGYGFSAHAAAKAAMDSLARVMAVELGPYGITVNTIGPGLTNTDATSGFSAEAKGGIAAMKPLRRIGEPDDVAEAAVFLASSLSNYLTGIYIPVTGGSLMI